MPESNSAPPASTSNPPAPADTRIPAGAPAPASTPAPSAPSPTSTGTPAPAASGTPNGNPAAPNANPDPASAPATGTWAENWRETYAGEDAKKLKLLQRYQSPTAALDALFAAQQKIRSGEVVTPPPENATPEQLSTWRKENGLPVEPKDYFANLPQGLVIGEQDMPIYESFAAEVLQKHNLPPAVAADLVTWYNKFNDENEAAQVERDFATRQQFEDELRNDWGPEYRANANIAKAVVQLAPPEVGQALMGARLPDGTPLGNHPGVMKWLTQIGREINPAGTILPGGAGSSAKNVETEIAELETFMKTNRPAWMADKGKNDRLLELYAAREKLAARG